MKKVRDAQSTAMREVLQRSGVGVPGSAAEAVIEELIGPHSALLGRRGPKRPSRKSADPAERAAADATRNRHSNSLSQIARMLHCEGFNEFAAFGVLHYAKNRLWGEKWGEEVEKRREEVSEQYRILSSEQRKAAGQFIHYQAAASFEAGLRIGLMASLWTLALVNDGLKKKP